MSSDTNNNMGNESDDETDEEHDEGGDEPVFKFSTITISSELRKTNENVKNLVAEFSCIAVHKNFLVIGKTTGEISIADHMGHAIPQYQIKAHTYPVNAISIDDNGDFIGSCCQEGKVKISGLFSKNDDQLITFSRPVKAICLDPNFSKTKMFVTGDTSLILNEKGTFGRHKTTTLYELNGGLIHTLRWKETLVAFANDKGVGVYDLRARRLVGFEETVAQKELLRGVYPSRISWNDPTTLAIACAQTIKIMTIATRGAESAAKMNNFPERLKLFEKFPSLKKQEDGLPVRRSKISPNFENFPERCSRTRADSAPLIATESNQEHQSTAPGKYMNTANSFKIEFYAGGLTSVNRDLVILGVENFSISNGTSELSLTVLSPKDKIYIEKAHDPFSMYGESQASPFQFQLEYLPDEKCFFILNPFDVVKAESRDYDDHIDFLINKNRFNEAINAFENPPSSIDRARRHNKQSIYRANAQYLINNGEMKKAVELFPLVYTTSAEWEDQILSFIQRNELDIIVPFIPTSKPQLEPCIYEEVLKTYLKQKKYDKLKELLSKWPSNIYNMDSIDQLFRLQTETEQTDRGLLECSVIIAEKQGNVAKTLAIYLKMGNIQVFQLIERKGLHGEIPPHFEKLMSINKNTLCTIKSSSSLTTTQQAAFVERFEYSSLFELNLKFVPLTSSNLFEQIYKQLHEEPSPTPAIPVTKAPKFTITYPNGKAISRLWKRENLFERLRNIFIEEKYDLNTFVVIDKNEILVDFTNTNARLPQQLSLEYFIIEKTSLFSIQFHFRTKLFEYFATSNSNIFTIINRFISDNDIQCSSKDIFLCFFDEHGITIDNVSIADLTHRMDQLQNKIISITVTEEDNTTAQLCEITLRSKQDQEQISLFHSTTKWQQISQWLKNFTQMIDSPVNEYAYFDKEQKVILEESQPISLVVEQTKSATIDGISRDTTTKVVFSYENNSASIYALKSMRICHLLNNEHLLRQLHLIDISPNDCVLVLGDTDDQVLYKEDIRQPVGNYSKTDDQPIHFRISISIQILTYDKQKPREILLSNRNTTIEHIFQLTHASLDVYKYLASNYTKKILDFGEQLSNLFDTKFILVQSHETCLISIENLKYNQLVDIEDDTKEIHQRFTIFATIADICGENQIDIDHQSLLHADDFVPSTDTELMSFLTESPIRFTLIDGNLPVTVTIQNSEDHRSIKFHCSLTITVKRLCFIACQLLGVNSNYYRLKQAECLIDDDDVTLDDIDSTMTEIQFQLISTASITSSIKYEDQTILLPCNYETSAATLIVETLQKLHIPRENRDMYELFALADDRTPIEWDISIEDVYQLFSSHPTTIPFELTKKVE